MNKININYLQVYIFYIQFYYVQVMASFYCLIFPLPLPLPLGREMFVMLVHMLCMGAGVGSSGGVVHIVLCQCLYVLLG